MLRTLKVLTVAVVMVALVALMASAAFAAFPNAGTQCEKVKGERTCQQGESGVVVEQGKGNNGKTTFQK